MMKRQERRPLDPSESARQSAKEEAVLLALQNDMALIRRDLEIFGMNKDGVTVFISQSETYEDLWGDALAALKKKARKV